MEWGTEWVIECHSNDIFILKIFLSQATQRCHLRDIRLPMPFQQKSNFSLQSLF